jgi:hypothetical protein
MIASRFEVRSMRRYDKPEGFVIYHGGAPYQACRQIYSLDLRDFPVSVIVQLPAQKEYWLVGQDMSPDMSNMVWNVFMNETLLEFGRND